MKRFWSLVLAIVMLMTAASFVTASADDDVTLTVVVGSNIQSFFEGEDENNNYMIDWLKEQTGYNYNWYILPSDNGAAKLNAMMASGNEVPDIIATGSRDTFLNYYDEGLIMNLDEYIADADTYFQYDTIGANKLGMLDGSYYAVATPGNQSGTTYLWWYDTKAVADAGITIEGDEITIDQYKEILNTLKAAYPDKITLASCGSDALDHLNQIFAAYGIANDFRIAEDGTLEYAMATEDVKECLEFLNELYTNGILDPEFMVTTKETLAPKLTNGEAVSAMFGWYDYTGTYRKAIEEFEKNEFGADVAVTENWKFVRIIDGGKATKGQTTGNLNQYYMMVSYACQHPQEAVNFLELTLSPEYYDKCFFGTEGVDYYYDENGTRWRNRETAIGDGFSVSGTQWYVYYYFSELGSQRMDRLGTGNPDYPYATNMIPWYDCKEVDNPLASMPAITEYTECMTDIRDVRNSYFIKFIMGDIGFDQWDAYLAELDAVGLSDVLTAVNEWYSTL